MFSDRNFNYRRIGLQAAFWFVMSLLLLTVLLNFVNLSNTNQLSAYDDDWDDMSAFRADLKAANIKTSSLVSSPLLLADIEDPRNTTYIVAGVERDTLSLPQFDEDGFITIAADDGYSPQRLTPLSNSFRQEAPLLCSTTMDLQERLRKHLASVILATNCTTQHMFLNSTITSSGCVSKQHHAA
jgi:hypothetical protein